MVRARREHARFRRRVFRILEDVDPGDGLSLLVNGFLSILICVSVVMVVVESVPEIYAAHPVAFRFFEMVVILTFTVEYGARLWVAPEHPARMSQGPWRARLGFAISLVALVDLAVIAPFYVAALMDIDLRLLFLLRLLRLFKLLRYSSALMTMERVLVNEHRALLACLMIMLSALVMASTLMYLAERHAQPEDFGSIPSTMWWGVATLTTVGYGDATPVTLLGKLIGGVVMLLGLGLFALPIGILATGFDREFRRHEFVVTGGMVARLAHFAGLPAREVGRLARLMRGIRYDAGDVIIRRGERVEAIYFLVAGVVEVELDGQVMQLRDRGFFGESALFKHGEDDLVAVALTRSIVIALEFSDAKALIARRPEIGENLAAAGDQRMVRD